MDSSNFTLYLLILAGVVALTWQWSAFRRGVRLVGMVFFTGLTALILAQLLLFVSLDSWMGGTLQMLWYVVATTLAARLIYLSLSAPLNRTRILFYSVAVVALFAFLAAVLVQESLWDEMDDGLSGVALWYAAILSSIVIAILWFTDAGRVRFAGALFAVFILFAGQSTLLYGSALSPVQLTAQGAAATHAALIRYHEATGHYPSTLAELSPRYLLLLPQPMLFRAKSWCYETANDGYRFGYVYRAGFGARATVRIVGAQGIESDRAWACAADAEHYNQTAFVHE